MQLLLGLPHDNFKRVRLVPWKNGLLMTWWVRIDQASQEPSIAGESKTYTRNFYSIAPIEPVSLCSAR